MPVYNSYNNYNYYKYTSYDYNYLNKNNKVNELEKAKMEIMDELFFYEPVTDQDIDKLKTFLEDKFTIYALSDIFNTYKSKKNKLNVSYKGGAEVYMDEEKISLFLKNKLICCQNWNVIYKGL